MSHQARIDLFGLLCGLSGWGIGYVLGILRERERLKEAKRRADWAYNRYWNGYDGDEF
jgi:hypothetical protein